MAFLVIDIRFGTPIHVFLTINPSGSDEFPELQVREVELQSLVPGSPSGLNGGVIGQHTFHRDDFREFGSEHEVMIAQFHLIEPRYVGSSWSTYVCNYLPAGSRKYLKSRSVRPSN
jgi:hypothetical protein